MTRNIKQYLSEAVEPKPSFEYHSFEYNGYRLAYFRIFSNVDRPYLLKKNINNSVRTEIVEYKKGDGFIRVGTSTEKICREHLEDIYKARYANQDRKKDLDIHCCLYTIGNNEDYRDGETLDFSIRNISNKSIQFDFELHIFYKNNLSIVSRIDREEASSLWSYYSPFGVNRPAPSSSGIFIQEKADRHIITSRFNSEIKLSQGDTVDALFQKDLLFWSQLSKITGVLILRSDDFTEGPLIIDLIKAIKTRTEFSIF